MNRNKKLDALMAVYVFRNLNQADVALIEREVKGLEAERAHRVWHDYGVDDYSSSLDDALLVFQLEDFSGPHDIRFNPDDDTGQPYTVTLSYQGKTYRASAEFPAEAICQAALKAVKFKANSVPSRFPLTLISAEKEFESDRESEEN